MFQGVTARIHFQTSSQAAMSAVRALLEQRQIYEALFGEQTFPGLRAEFGPKVAASE